MRIDAFLEQSPMFAVSRAARRFDALAARAMQADGLNFLEGLTLAALFFDEPTPVKPSKLAETFSTTRGNVSHCVSALEAKGFLHRVIDSADARSYLLGLTAAGRRTAMRVIKALDKLQAEFEHEAGKDKLHEALNTLRRVEAVAEKK
jgi:DNA-binding MarR family transcriptional regulator